MDPILVTPKILALQYDGTNISEIMALAPTWVLVSNVDGVLTFQDGWAEPVLNIGDWVLAAGQNSSSAFPGSYFSDAYVAFTEAPPA